MTIRHRRPPQLTPTGLPILGDDRNHDPRGAGLKEVVKKQIPVRLGKAQKRLANLLFKFVCGSTGV
jgi:hypothetical protein